MIISISIVLASGISLTTLIAFIQNNVGVGISMGLSFGSTIGIALGVVFGQLIKKMIQRKTSPL